MSITYVDLLSTENLHSFQTFTLLTNPNSRDVLDENYVFHYKIGFDSDRLTNQSIAFAKIVSSMQYDPRFSTTTWNSAANVRVILRELFKYSFFKTLYLIHAVKQGTEPFVPSGSLLFIGHKVLYLVFRTRILGVEQIPSNSIVQKTLALPDLEYEQLLIENSMLRSISENGGFIPEYELMFKNLKSTIPQLEIVNVSDITLINGQSCPLGNMCFTFDNNVKFLTIKQPYNYRSSMFWNTANFITLMTEQTFDSNSNYSVMPISDLSEKSFDFEVYAITGLDPNADVGRYPKGYSSKSSPNPTLYGPKTNGNNSNKGTSSNSNNSKSTPNGSNGNSIIDGKASKIVDELFINNKIDVNKAVKMNTKFRYLGDNKIYISSKDQTLNNKIIVEFTIEDKINAIINKAKDGASTMFVDTLTSLYRLVNRQYLSLSELRMLQTIYNVTLIDIDIVNSPGSTVNV